MRTILVTGATGFLGCHLTMELLKTDDFNVIAIGGKPEDKANILQKHSRLKVYPLHSLFDEFFFDVDTVINCAFSRNNDAKQLADAFDFTEMAIKRFEEMKVKSVINISTQGVYQRLCVGELSKEDSPIEPIDLYSMAKYACEKLFRISQIPYVNNIRLSSLYMPQRFLRFFIQKVIADEPFTVTAPYQYASLLDISDAASGLASITKLSPEKRADIYNLGIGTQYSLLDYAESVRRIGGKFGYDVKYNVSDNGTTLCAGMDCSRLFADTGWRASILKDEMITNLFKQKDALT